jgi:hypothetical protein
MSIMGHLAAIAAPWASFYNDSTATQALIAFGHFGGMMVAGGSAVTADRGALQACRQAGSGRLRRVDDISGAHRAVIVALAVTSISGVLMLAADLENLARSPWFWLKMSLLLLLIINGWFMTRISQHLRRDAGVSPKLWSSLRLSATASLVLWFAVLLAGTLLSIA